MRKMYISINVYQLISLPLRDEYLLIGWHIVVEESAKTDQCVSSSSA